MIRNRQLFFSFIFNRYFSTNMQVLTKLVSDLDKLNHVDLVQNYLDCSKQEAINSLVMHESLHKLTKQELYLRLNVMQRMGISDVKKKDLLFLAKHHPTTVKNRVMSLEECGFLHNKITTLTVKKYLIIMHMKIELLKQMSYIKNDTDVYKSLLKHAELIEPEVPTCNKNEIVNVKKDVLKMLLKSEIGISDEMLHQKVEILKRLKNKSIRLIRQNLKIAKDVLGISVARIRRNPYVLWADPENTIKLIEEIKELGGVDIKLCMALFPKILLSPSDNALEMKKCLKEYNISDVAIQKALCIFTLSSVSVRKRLEELETNEQFAIARQHPRVLLIVYHYNKITLRLRLLEEMNISNIPISSVSTGSQKRFDRYYEHGLIRQSGSDITMYICNELDCNKLDFRNKMKGCSFWRFVQPVQIIRNLKLLREQGFCDKEIFNSVHILFYENSKVAEELNSLISKEGIDCCMENGVVKREFILPLVIYFIDKCSNFSDHSFCAAGDITHSDITMPVE